MTISPSFLPLFGQEITEFDPKMTERMNWRIEDDGVMGGLSQGSYRVTPEGILIFHGTLSLENNGGFSSVQTGELDLDLEDWEGLALRVKGDGRTYQLWVGTDERYQGREMAFTADFPTTADEWIEVKVPFESLVGNFRGRTLENRVFDPGQIRRLRILLGDKQPGPFELKVDWIRAYR